MNDEQFVPDRIEGAFNEYEKERIAKEERARQQAWDLLHPIWQPMVYVSGPITQGDQFANCREGIEVGDLMRENGVVPMVPHLSGLWAFVTSYSHEQWLAYDAQMILRCDAVYRMEGHSPGGDWEVQFAEVNSIPVYYARDFFTVAAFCEHILSLEMAVS